MERNGKIIQNFKHFSWKSLFCLLFINVTLQFDDFFFQMKFKKSPTLTVWKISHNLWSICQIYSKMNYLREFLYRPKRSDRSLISRFYWADLALTAVASELDSFDGRKDPERCASLVNKLRSCQVWITPKFNPFLCWPSIST